MVSDARAERACILWAFDTFYRQARGAIFGHTGRSPWPETRVRLIGAIARMECVEVADLRKALRMDPGHLSRLLAGMRAAGLVTCTSSPRDRRCQVVRITDLGSAQWRSFESWYTTQAQRLLSRFEEHDQQRLVTAMATIQEVLAHTPAGGPCGAS